MAGREAGPGALPPAQTQCRCCGELATPPHPFCPACIEAGYIAGPSLDAIRSQRAKKDEEKEAA
jgi:hypothetical protein